MAEKTTIKVLIDGKIMTLSGYESEEYLQRISYYLNSKIEELKVMAGYSRLSQDIRSDLLALNIADDYFKARERVRTMEQDIENKDRDTYDIRQQLVAFQIENEKLRREVERLKGVEP